MGGGGTSFLVQKTKWLMSDSSMDPQGFLLKEEAGRSHFRGQPPLPLRTPQGAMREELVGGTSFRSKEH